VTALRTFCLLVLEEVDVLGGVEGIFLAEGRVEVGGEVLDGLAHACGPADGHVAEELLLG
jgi:hypothetical protein